MWNSINYLTNENNVLKHKYEILISQVIPEILGIKTRMEVFERNEINKNIILDMIVKDLVKQKMDVQNKLNDVDRSISHINVKLREITEQHKGKVKTHDKICKFDRTGFCRERHNCPYFHASKICEQFANSGVCTESSCRERHPKR